MFWVELGESQIAFEIHSLDLIVIWIFLLLCFLLPEEL